MSYISLLPLRRVLFCFINIDVLTFRTKIHNARSFFFLFRSRQDGKSFAGVVELVRRNANTADLCAEKPYAACQFRAQVGKPGTHRPTCVGDPGPMRLRRIHRPARQFRNRTL